MTLIVPLDHYMKPSFLYDCAVPDCRYRASVIQSKDEKIPRDLELCWHHFPQP